MSLQFMGEYVSVLSLKFRGKYSSICFLFCFGELKVILTRQKQKCVYQIGIREQLLRVSNQ